MKGRESTPQTDAEGFIDVVAAAADEGRLIAQQCAECAHWRWLPSEVCPACFASSYEWSRLTGTGTLYSYSTYHRAMAPEFADDVPYSVGMILLDEGITMIGRLAKSPTPVIGHPVVATFQPHDQAGTLIEWAAST